MSELYNIFLKIKKQLYEKDFKKFDLPELVDLILEENKTEQDYEKLRLVYKYITEMEKALEDLGTLLIELDRFDIKNISVSKLEIHIRNIILIIDQFIDGLAALFRIIEFDKSKLKLKQALAYLKSIRNLIIQKTNDYKLKINKTELDTDVFFKFLIDTIDTFLREAYVIRVLKIKEVIAKTINYD